MWIHCIKKPPHQEVFLWLLLSVDDGHDPTGDNQHNAKVPKFSANFDKGWSGLFQSSGIIFEAYGLGAAAMPQENSKVDTDQNRADIGHDIHQYIIL